MKNTARYTTTIQERYYTCIFVVLRIERLHLPPIFTEGQLPVNLNFWSGKISSESKKPVTVALSKTRAGNGKDVSGNSICSGLVNSSKLSLMGPT